MSALDYITPETGIRIVAVGDIIEMRRFLYNVQTTAISTGDVVCDPVDGNMSCAVGNTMGIPIGIVLGLQSDDHSELSEQLFHHTAYRGGDIIPVLIKGKIFVRGSGANVIGDNVTFIANTGVINSGVGNAANILPDSRWLTSSTGSANVILEVGVSL